MQRLLRPLREVSDVAEKLAQGDTDVNLPRGGEDEFGQMATSFGRTVAYLAEIAGTAERVADGDLTATVEPRSERDALGGSLARMIAGLRDVVGRVSGAATQVATASKHVAATSEDAGRAVGEIALAVGEVATGAERQVAMVEEARESTQQSSDAAERARELADDGASAVAEATAAMEAVRITSADVSAAIRALAGKSDEIGGIVETITGISGQTNLLALNAAIEAARAGEQGRGFAVVADEVRKLAEESQKAASSIADLIAEIQGDTVKVVEVVEAGAAQTEQGVRVVEHAREAFDSIGTAVVEMASQAGGIASAMTEVVSVAEQSSASTQQVSATTQETTAATQEIASSAQELARTAANLQELVAKFKLDA
jgi:methyl-accepting chemotaxis protein